MATEPGGDPTELPFRHPRGTLAIVAIYGLMFVVGWLILYFFVFVPRGPLTQ